jgi:activator of HSP90 ATPase
MGLLIRSGTTFPVSARELYRVFMTSRLHAAATGAPARISPRVGGRFAVFDGAITGRTLHLVPGKLVVQTWRSSHWAASDPDSVLIVRFSGTAKAGRMDLVHEGVPSHDYRGVKDGWNQYYWKPWKAYFAARHMKSQHS